MVRPRSNPSKRYRRATQAHDVMVDRAIQRYSGIDRPVAVRGKPLDQAQTRGVDREVDGGGEIVWSNYRAREARLQIPVTRFSLASSHRRILATIGRNGLVIKATGRQLRKARDRSVFSYRAAVASRWLFGTPCKSRFS